MADKGKKSTMKGFATNDQADYYSGIISITGNGKNAYELKGKFLDDLHKNAFSGTNGEDAVEHIEYFLKIVYPIDLTNVNQDKLRVVALSISLVGDAWRWFDGIKGSITRSDEIEPTNDETSDLKETDHDDEQEIGEIFRIETNLFDYETSLCKKFKEFNYLLKIDPDLLTKDIERFKNYKEFKDDQIYEWNKDNAYKDKNRDHEYDMDHEVDERQEICSNETHELPICTVRRLEMIKYSFGQDEEYVAVKEDEYEDLTSTSKDA
uniref:Uncharacterized protein n=1 Tax=Tanacetum cinerariifolium TaxID=118510 RepID=A0A6L2L0F4_TANCI|nr:hypothetical protein [Tanacetum cinerariifolium]